MPRDIVPKSGPHKEISTAVKPHNRPYTGPQGFDRAMAAATALPRDQRYIRDFERAQQHLRNLLPVAAIELMEDMGIGMLELYLLAEEHDQNREFIMRSFPKPGLKARVRYTSHLAPQRKPRASRKVAVAAGG